MTLAEQLADAKAKYHLLVTGAAPRVFVDQNGERIEYAPANAARLSMYIERLEKLVAGSTPSGPMQILM